MGSQYNFNHAAYKSYYSAFRIRLLLGIVSSVFSSSANSSAVYLLVFPKASPCLGLFLAQLVRSKVLGSLSGDIFKDLDNIASLLSV